MKVRRYRMAVLLLLVLAAVIAVNGLALWGDRFALWVDNAMQLSAGLTAVVCGWVVGRRMRGAQRWWRLLIAVGMLGWSGGQIMWSWYQLIDGRGLPSPSLADVGYLTFPGFALAGLFVLARARSRPDRQRWLPGRWNAHFGAAVVIDGLVVTGSLFILTWTAALGAVVRATGPDALAWVVAIAYPLSDLVLVVVAVLMVVFDRVDRPYRANLLLLAAGIVALACSDSIFAYLVSIGAQSMKPWADAGFVLGPLLIAFALLAVPGRRSEESQPAGVDWWQMALPYLPVTAVALLISGQLLFGDGPDGVEVAVGVIVIFLVLARQLLSLMDNRLLLRRVYEGQQQLAHQAFHDPLTGLANRTLFAERLDRAIADGAGGGALVLIFVDLDDFKEVNDQFGHAGGDVVLHAVGQRLLRCLRSSDTVARLGGDEFAILLDGEIDAPAGRRGPDPRRAAAPVRRARHPARRRRQHGRGGPGSRRAARHLGRPARPGGHLDVRGQAAGQGHHRGVPPVAGRPAGLHRRAAARAGRRAGRLHHGVPADRAARRRDPGRGGGAGPVDRAGRHPDPAPLVRPARRKAPGSVPSWTRWRSTWRAARSPPPSWS